MAATRKSDPDRVRAGRNAPTAAEQATVALFDRAKAALFLGSVSATDAAEALGVPLSALSHLRSNLTHYSYARRQKAEALAQRYFAYAALVLERSPDPLATLNARTLGRHLARELAILRRDLNRRVVSRRV